MTVRVTQKMRKRIDARKRIVAMKKEKELVTDSSHRDIHKRGFIYESPDGGKTIYRRPSSKASARCQAELDFLYVAIEKDKEREKENEVMELVLKMEDKISQVVTLIGEITEEVKKLRDNN